MASPEKSDYRKYFALILQRKYLFTAVAVTVCTLGILFSYMQSEKYEAKSTVFIEKSLMNELFKGMPITQSIEDRLKVISTTLGSRTLLLKVVDRLEPDLSQTDQERAAAMLSDFQEQTEVTVKEKDLFTITYRGDDPQLARDYVNTLIETYIDENLSASRRNSTGANQFIAQQMEHFRTKLQEAEARLADFRKRENFSLNDESMLLVDLRDAQKDLNELNNRRNELLAKKQLLARGTAPDGSAAEHLMNLQRQRDTLLLVYTEKYPEVQILEAEIAAVKNALRRGASSSETNDEDFSLEGSMIGIELEALDRQEQQLQQEIQEIKATLASVPEKRKTLTDLERDRDAYKATYEDLVTTYGKSELTRQMGLSNQTDMFRIVDPAILPTVPATSNRVLFILTSLFLGVGAAFGLVFAIDYFDPNLRGVESLQDLGIPVIALIPIYTSEEDRARERKKTVMLSAFASLYLVAVGGILMAEMMNLTGTPATEGIQQVLGASKHVAGHLISPLLTQGGPQ